MKLIDDLKWVAEKFRELDESQNHDRGATAFTGETEADSLRAEQIVADAIAAIERGGTS